MLLPRTAEEELRLAEELRLTAELLLEEELLRTPAEEPPRAAEELLTVEPVLFAVRLRTADEDTGATDVPEVRRPSILAVDARDTRDALEESVPLERRAEEAAIILLPAARRFTLLPIAVA